MTTSIHLRGVVAAGTINTTKRKAGRDWTCARNAEMRNRLPTASSRICLRRKNLSKLGHLEICDLVKGEARWRLNERLLFQQSAAAD
jgi:hypothetical protein